MNKKIKAPNKRFSFGELTILPFAEQMVSNANIRGAQKTEYLINQEDIVFVRNPATYKCINQKRQTAQRDSKVRRKKHYNK